VASELTVCPHCGRESRTIWGACPECGRTKDASALPPAQARTWRGEPGGWFDDLDFLTYGALGALGGGLVLLVLGLALLESVALAVVGGAILLAVAGLYLVGDYFSDW
jgi:hypothetical protein